MKCLFDVGVIALLMLALFFTINSNYLSYHNCMSQTKSSYISKEGVAHTSAQCRIFILEKAFTNK